MRPSCPDELNRPELFNAPRASLDGARSVMFVALDSAPARSGLPDNKVVSAVKFELLERTEVRF